MEGRSAGQHVRVTAREVLADLLAKDRTIVGARVGGRVLDLHTPFERDPSVKVEPIRTSDPEGLRIIRHSTAHVMADAVQRLFPGTKVTIGPAIEAGFYYDFDRPSGPFTDDDLEKIEAKMREIISAGKPFRRELVDREAAHQLFAGMGETYKREIIDAIPVGEDVSLYHHSDGARDWVDLCEGPHVPDTSYLAAIKLVSVAGAYWRGDERNPMLQRIYGTAFPSQKALEAHLKLIAEAKERDHRKLGKELELFMFHEYAPAMPFLLPRGAFVYNALVSYVRDLYVDYRYEEVITPQIFDKKLFDTSGHLPNYRENMYLPVTAEYLDQARMALRLGVGGEGEAYREADTARDAAVIQQLGELEKLAQKPMNCPSHCLIFGQRRRSYRELPWRVADFGRLHRYERGGVVHGLARVRSFCQDDAHIFCAPDQIQSEIASFLDLLQEVYAAFKFEKVDIKLATRPKKRIGSDAQWDAAESALAEALKGANLRFEVAPEEGAFYGPKLEFHVEDALRRSWQLGTIQVDYALPDRFDLEFTGSDGISHRPVMLHRAILGSLERFLSVYLEHVAGAFPVWLAPEQAVVVTVSEKQAEYADEVVAMLRSRRLRVRADTSSDKLGAKIRNARLLRVPYVVVVGDKEAAERKVAPRSRDLNKDLGAMLLEEFADKLQAEAIPPRLQKSARPA
ncbi:Threonyl-tRNA synthetase [Chondromyces apiculatus DSM 436]|uniref:Threonine--tRNA ligase n=1 Tax=Chondromyces apiculatus DSM 436 TaxID=1192034 RepID=A0A017TDL5_9BACT|nr:Threonyl-tRNA synthetase [Chondromyces apiculatus DSM 436]